MITHYIESYWIQSQKKTKPKLQILKFAKISNFEIFKQTLHATHLLKLLDKMCKYEMDPMSIVEDTDYRVDTILSTDGQTDKVKPLYFVEAEGITRQIWGIW